MDESLLDVLTVADTGTVDVASDGGGWLDGFLGGVGDIASTAAGAYGSYVAGQNAVNQANAQRAYLQTLAVSNAQQSAMQQNRALYLAAGILIFVLLLRQTAQVR